MSTTNPLDTILLSIGKPGRYQIFLFILLCTNAYPITFNFLYITFFTNVPDHHCKIDGVSNPSDSYFPHKLNDKGIDVRSSCSMYESPHNTSYPTKEIFCNDGYQFNLNEMETTIAVEWDLVCTDRYLATLASTIFFGGVMVGGLIFGPIADKFGRRPVVLITLYGQMLFGFIAAFSPHYIVFVIVKFFQGMCLQGLQSSNNSVVMEMFPMCYRTLAGMILAMCATSAHMFMAPLLYYVPWWNKMQLLISCLTGVTIFYSWLYPESIRWLLSHDKQDEAASLVKKFAASNKMELPLNTDERLQEISRDIRAKSAATKKYDIRDLVRKPTMRRYTLSLLLAWFSVSLTYYGIQFYIPKMGGGYFRYLNLFASGALETGARIVGYFIIDKIGRRRPLVFFYAASALLCIASGIVGTFSNEIAANVLAILGKLCSAQCFAFILIYSSEIFPTVIRTAGLGLVACVARIGTMLAPQILSLRTVTLLYVPFIIFGSASLLSAITLYFMPETKGKPLPNTVEDVEDFQNAPILSKVVEANGIDNLGAQLTTEITPTTAPSTRTSQQQPDVASGVYRKTDSPV